MRFLKFILVELLGLVHAFPTGITETARIRDLMKRLYPVTGGYDLVRLGPAADGGYLVPDDFDGIRACFSPGISTESGFELDCAERGIEVFLADRSVDGPAEAHERFHFTKSFIGATSGEGFLTLDDWVTSSLSDAESDLLLQMDIEGYEYEVLLAASAALMRRLRIVIVEFHRLDHLWSKPFFGLAGRVFDKILRTHTCVHIHPNNCCGVMNHRGLDIPLAMEFTFLRNDRIRTREPRLRFPHPLDAENVPGRSIVLPADWYGSA